jgi:hypothetical protein
MLPSITASSEKTAHASRLAPCRTGLKIPISVNGKDAVDDDRAKVRENCPVSLVARFVNEPSMLSIIAWVALPWPKAKNPSQKATPNGI